MTRYLISFDDGEMTFPEEELPDVAEAAHAVAQAARDSGVWVFGGGLHSYEEVSVVATDGTVTDGPRPEGKAYIGGFAVVDVTSREEALGWAARFAVACRCAQEVREFVPDPTARSAGPHGGPVFRPGHHGQLLVDHASRVQHTEHPGERDPPCPPTGEDGVPVPVDQAAFPGAGRCQARGGLAPAVREPTLDAIAGGWGKVGERGVRARRAQRLPRATRMCRDLPRECDA